MARRAVLGVPRGLFGALLLEAGAGSSQHGTDHPGLRALTFSLPWPLGLKSTLQGHPCSWEQYEAGGSMLWPWP